MPSDHFWYGYSITHSGQWVDDVITVYTSGRVLAHGYHIFLLEAVLSESQILELDLVCEHNGKERFACMYNGRNVHYFTIPVIPGHRYYRRITFDDNITYFLEDMTTHEVQIYELPIKGSPLKKVFRGVEWHGSATPFQLKYEAVIEFGDAGMARKETDKNKHPYPIEITSRKSSLLIKNKTDIPPIVPITLLVILAAVLDRSLVRGFIL